MSRDKKLADEVLDWCRQRGASDFIVCAGARNAAVVRALADRARRDPEAYRVVSFFEERSAAFFALGRVIAAGRPAAVLTTSGTAAAELFPAVIEAHYRDLPVIAVTADRPKRFRGSGAPQSIEQAGLFGSYARTAADLDRPGQLPDAEPAPGPVHLNVCFEEPGAADDEAPSPAAATALREIPSAAARPIVLPPEAARDSLRSMVGAGNAVVLLGELPERGGWREAARSFLTATRLPFWAEATSGLREEPALAPRRVAGALAERSLSGGEFGGVIRIGGVPSCRFWRDLEGRPEISVLSAAPAGFSGLARPSAVTRSIDALGGDWPAVEGGAPGTRADPASRFLEVFPGSEPAAVRRLSEAIPAGSLVFLGSSLPIREWNAFASLDPRGHRVFANRGANGIDGMVSTFFGLSAEASDDEAWAVVGDLGALYDLAAPWVASQLPARRRRIAVINNRGGRIFSRVAAYRGVDAATMAAVENRHDLSFRAWAAMWGFAYFQVDGQAPIPPIEAGCAVVEIVPHDAETAALYSQLDAIPISEVSQS